MERLGYFDSMVPSLTCILMKQHGVSGGKYLLKTPENAISETQNVHRSMPWPSRTCAFCASSKAAYYSLSGCYLKTF